MLKLNIEISDKYLINIQRVLRTKLKLANESYNNIVLFVSQYKELSVECMQIIKLLIEHSIIYNNEKLVKKILLLSKTNKNAHFLLFKDSNKLIFDNYIILKEVIIECLNDNKDYYKYIVDNYDVAKNKLINIVKIINDYNTTKETNDISVKLLQDICSAAESTDILKDIYHENICGIDFRNVIDFSQETKTILKNIMKRGTNDGKNND